MYGFWNTPQQQRTDFGESQDTQLFKPRTSAVISADAGDAFYGVGTLNADRTLRRVEEAQKTGNKITEEQYKANPDLYSEGIPWTEGMTEESAKELKQFNDAILARRKIRAEASDFQSILGFGAALATGTFEPKNFGVGLAVSAGTAGLGSIGVLGNTVRRAYQLRRSLKLGQKVGIGVGEGIVAGAVVEPGNQSTAKGLYQEYTFQDSLFNIATSAAFGGIVPVVGAAGSKLSPIMESKLKRFRSKATEVVADEVDMAASQMALGQFVNIEAVEAQASLRSNVVHLKDEALANFMIIARDSPRMSFLIKEGISRLKTVPQIAEELNPVLFKSVKEIEQKSANIQRFIDELSAKKQADDQVKTKQIEEIDTKIANLQRNMRTLGKRRKAEKQVLVDELLKEKDVIRQSINDFQTPDIVRLREELVKNDLAIRDKALEIGKTFKQARQEHALQKLAIKETDEINLNKIKEYNKKAFDYRNDTLINYNVIERGPSKDDIKAEVKQANDYLDTEADAEIQAMREQGIITEKEFNAYQNAVSSVPEKMTAKAIDVIKTCFTRG
ncbi:hypothetical protein UFOVP354_33 [uncultured Caudovirales phage]|uniref:Uncharacterized protein n=1 Tax=uncultured Caudovirales phage TaxID=2100421 RepID=A0A6J5M325_9CAUD|nr:hypothetical protein UFOVP354_33 [uncultured Caudovirales phage]